ncbi:hypothetical protein BJX70DRAFT_396591 [Aspergillus crustosus]
MATIKLWFLRGGRGGGKWSSLKGTYRNCFVELQDKEPPSEPPPSPTPWTFPPSQTQSKSITPLMSAKMKRQLSVTSSTSSRKKASSRFPAPHMQMALWLKLLQQARKASSPRPKRVPRSEPKPAPRNNILMACEEWKRALKGSLGEDEHGHEAPGRKDRLQEDRDMEDVLQWLDDVHAADWPELWGAIELMKEDLITCLQDFCVQDDFDSIVSRLSPVHRKGVLVIFAKVYLMKTIVENFLSHPFWYAEGLSPEEKVDTRKAPWVGVTPDGRVLERFLARFEEEDPLYARHWRNATARLCNSMYDEDGRNPFGEILRSRRHARCHSLASKILQNNTFRCLLARSASSKDTDNRKNGLGNCLTQALDHIIKMVSSQSDIKFRKFDDLDPQLLHKSEIMEAHYLHKLQKAEDDVRKVVDIRLDGHKVLIIGQPSIVYMWKEPSEKEFHEKMVCKAVAVMEDLD